METLDYWIYSNDTIIFKPEFNKPIDSYSDIISQYSKLIFSNYNNLDDCIKFNNADNTKTRSEFHQSLYLSNYLNLTHITLGSCFNNPLQLPKNLTHLVFDFYYNAYVKFPDNLTHLTFGICFRQKINLPESIRYLKLNCNNQYLIDNLPNSIEELELGPDFNLEMINLPNGIKKIIFDKKSKYNKELNCLPDSVEYIQISENYNKQLLKKPKNLITIVCSKNYEYIKDLTNNNIEIC